MQAHLTKSPLAIALVSFALLASPLASNAAVSSVTDADTDSATTVLTFIGEVNESTCTFKQASGEIKLDKVSKSMFDSSNKTGGRQRVKIEVSGCGTTPVELKLNFESGANVDPQTGRLKLPKTDKSTDGLELQFLDEKEDVINLFNNVTPHTVMSDTNGNATFNYHVEYYGDGVIAAGKRTAGLKATLAYP
jgi:major type 1 subunit fimbrin (pilin)